MRSCVYILYIYIEHFVLNLVEDSRSQIQGFVLLFFLRNTKKFGLCCVLLLVYFAVSCSCPDEGFRQVSSSHLGVFMQMSLCDQVHGLVFLVFYLVGVVLARVWVVSGMKLESSWLGQVLNLLLLGQRESQNKGGYGVELLEVQLRILLGGLSCLAMDPTVLPIIKCFCGSLVASISGELHLPLQYYPSLD